ncbi:MAG: hypothetical protein ACRCV3_05965 [Desulfovibrionaceae bacterium]
MKKLQGCVEPLSIITKEAQVCLRSDGEEYIIAHKGAGADIVNYIGEEIEIMATPVQSALDKDITILLVRSYSFVNE